MLAFFDIAVGVMRLAAYIAGLYIWIPYARILSEEIGLTIHNMQTTIYRVNGIYLPLTDPFASSRHLKMAQPAKQAMQNGLCIAHVHIYIFV